MDSVPKPVRLIGRMLASCARIAGRRFAAADELTLSPPALTLRALIPIIQLGISDTPPRPQAGSIH